MAKKAEKPQHAPSAKLALDDVLKSLQDLIRNDLTDGVLDAAPATAIATPAEGETDLSKPLSTKEVIQELEAGLAELMLPLTDPTVSAATTTPSFQENVDAPDKALMLPPAELALPASEPTITASPASASEFLQDPTPAEMEIAPLAPPPDTVADSEFLQDEPHTDSEIASLDNVTLDFGDHTSSSEIEWDQRLSDPPKNPSPAPSLARTVEFAVPSAMPPLEKMTQPRGLQGANDTKIPAASTPPGRPKARGGILTQGRQAELPLTPPEPPLSPAPTQPGAKPANSFVPDDALPRPSLGSSAFVPDDALPRPSLGSWVNIPVLQDAVDAPETPLTTPTSNAHPSQGQAHRMAIQIAARLNVELRRAGKPPLSSDIVTRLVHLLKETLALGMPNVDNKPQRKD